MRLLLDTHSLLWFLTDNPKLGSRAKAVIEDPANERWLSPISLLEIAIKHRLGKLPLPAPFGTLFPASLFPASLLADDIQLLPLDVSHLEQLILLPLHHRDPFDHVIAATAIVEELTLVSVDVAFDRYGLDRLW